MHSVATTLTSDLYRHIHTTGSESHYLGVARILTVGLGVLGTAAAMLLATFPVESLWDVFLAVVGLFGGSMAGLFLLGMFSRTAGAAHAWIGVLVSMVALVYVKFGTDAHGLLYAGVGVLGCFLVGAMAGWVKPAVGRAEIHNLTVYGLWKNRHQAS
jgi:Na+/proline symporter